MNIAVEPQGIVTRNLLPMYDESRALESPTNWLAFAGRGGGEMRFEEDVDQVEYEIIRGHRQMSQLIKRSNVTSHLLGSNQQNLGIGDSTQVARAFPLSIEEYNIQVSKLTKKIPNEPNTNSGYTRQDRMMYWAAKGQTDMMIKQARMMNYLCGQGIREGIQDAIIGTSNTVEQYDFYRNSENIKTLGVPWTTHATATPLKDTDAAVDATIKNGHRRANIGLYGDEAWANFLQCAELETFSTYSDFKAFIPAGSENASMPAEMQFLVDNNWDYQGIVKTWKGRKIYAFTSEELVEVTPGAGDTRSMPSEEVVFCNANSRLDQIFGPPETFPEDDEDVQRYARWFGFMPGVTPSGEPNITQGLIRPEMFYIDAYQNKQKTLRVMRSQTAPLYVPVATDQWYTITNAGG
jgi:hypothetical protein